MLALALLLAQDPQITGERSLVSKCPVDVDPEYGYVKAKPIKVGGSPMFGAARQRAYLQALVGPGGQPITFKRRGSMPTADERIFLDLYEVMYPGLEKPIELYLDFYRWEIPRAPAGFLCAAEFRLGPPPPDPFLLHENVMRVAIERSAVDPLPPIPLSATEPDRGMVFDGLRRVSVVARHLAKKGPAPTPRDIANVPYNAMLVVANPITCNGETAEPEGIGVVMPQGRSIDADGALLTGSALREALPGIELRKGAVGAAFRAPAPPSNSRIAIKYRGSACGTTPAEFPMTFAPPKRVEMVDAVMPDGVDPTAYVGHVSVGVRFTVGPDGRTSDLSIVSGEARFAEAAMEAVRQWRYELPTVNGWPVFVPITMTSSVRVVKR